MSRCRFLRSISSNEGWFYQPGQVVAIGAVFTAVEIPAEKAAAFLTSGVVEMVEEKSEAATQLSVETASLKPRRTKRAE